MRGKIDKNGFLHIERRGKMIMQRCPHSVQDGCGDWCPLFGEPEFISCGKEKRLELCGKTLIFDNLEKE
jgi:hypothetical protein